MNREEVINRIRECEWKYWNETDQLSDEARYLSLKLGFLKTALQSLSESDGTVPRE